MIFSRETKDETTLLVRDELRRQEDLEKRRLDFETKEMEKQAKNIFDQEAEVTGNTVKCDLISLFITQGRSTWAGVEVHWGSRYFLPCLCSKVLALAQFVKVSCFSEATLTRLKREMASLRSCLLQRRLLQRWLRTVQKRNREREKENELVR